jgi:hypothetical protein
MTAAQIAQLTAQAAKIEAMKAEQAAVNALLAQLRKYWK